MLRSYGTHWTQGRLLVVLDIGKSNAKIVLLDPLSSVEMAHELATRVLQVLRAPISTAAGDLAVNASIGVVVIETTADASLSNLIQKADAAMYRSKNAGKDCVTLLRL